MAEMDLDEQLPFLIEYESAKSPDWLERKAGIRKWAMTILFNPQFTEHVLRSQ